MAAVWSERSRAAVSSDFQYNIISITNTGPGQFPVVTFSVTDPNTGAPYALTGPIWKTSGVSSLAFQIGWSTSDFTNTNSGVNTGAALPIRINALDPAVVPNGDGTYTATSKLLPIPSTATGTGEVAMEGHPAGQDATGAWTVRVPVKSVYKYFVITGDAVARRAVVDINKCMRCHRSDGTGVAPRLTLHGNSRTEEPQVCVICHNPNNTDIPYRLATDPQVRVGSFVYPEQSIDFKRLIHGIHATARRFRTYPLVVIGFNHSVFDASTLKEYPADLKECARCHIDDGTRGTFELPLGSNVLGSTVDSRSSFNSDGSKTIDTDPDNDWNITPTAAACSACHDGREAVSHMISTGGASFRTTQAAIIPGAIQERCVNCHGPGRDKSVRKVHHDD